MSTEKKEKRSVGRPSKEPTKMINFRIPVELANDAKDLFPNLKEDFQGWLSLKVSQQKADNFFNECMARERKDALT